MTTQTKLNRERYQSAKGIADWWAKDGAWHIAIPCETKGGDFRYTVDAYSTREEAIAAIEILP